MHSIEEITDIIITISSDYEIDEAYIFGSYARGEADDLSDIDIAIKTSKLSALQLSSLSYKIEHALGVRVDLISIDMMDDEFKLAICRESIQII